MLLVPPLSYLFKVYINKVLRPYSLCSLALPTAVGTRGLAGTNLFIYNFDFRKNVVGIAKHNLFKSSICPKFIISDVRCSGRETKLKACPCPFIQ